MADSLLTALGHMDTVVAHLRDTISFTPADTPAVELPKVFDLGALVLDIVKIIVAPAIGGALAIWGGYAVQKHRSDREERRAEEVAARTDEEIRNQIAIGVSHICSRLRPVRDKIERYEAVFSNEILEITRRVRSFEALMPRLLQLRDQAHATAVYLWFSQAEWLPEDLELLAGSMRNYSSQPEPVPRDPKLASIAESLGKPQHTRGEAALLRIDSVLAGERALGPSLDIYEAGDRIVPILTSRPAPRASQPSTPSAPNQDPGSSTS